MKTILTLLLFAGLNAFAVSVREVTIPSASMSTNVPVAVLLPNGYEKGTERYPVLYYLHGAYDSWRSKYLQADVRRFADETPCIVVFPDGGRTCWWLDSPVDPKVRYETFVSKEVVAWADANLRTIPDRKHRALTGYSMGGHGSALMAMRHKETFGCAAPIIGGFDLPPYAGKYDLDLRLGDIKTHPDGWRNNSVMEVAKTLKNGEIDLTIIDGTGDFFLKANRDLHRLLTEAKVEHAYVEIRGRDDSHSSHNNYFINTYGHPYAFDAVRRFFRGR